jgi:starch-binding outer membrane protein, SusD/RagB family
MTKSLSALTALVAVLSLAGCDSLLDTSPPDRLSEDKTIQDPAGARAALSGAYAGLRGKFYTYNNSYYGGMLTHFGDLYSDNAVHTGDFFGYKQMGDHLVTPTNLEMGVIWADIYDAIKRANTILDRVPRVGGFAPGEQDQILGEAHFLRALHYHNLVRLFGGVPLLLKPITGPSQTENFTRATVAEVYTQILADLGEAETRMTTLTDPDNHATVAAAKALLARVYLYQGDYPNALARAQEVAAMGYSLAPNYSDLFTGDDADTPENIFRASFTTTQFNTLGRFWLSLDVGGNQELSPSRGLMDAYDTTGTDLRFAWNVTPDATDGFQEQSAYGSKWPSVTGEEDFHVIRFAEILVIEAECYARQGQLANAVAAYNPIRVRAGLPQHVLGVDVTTQQEVLDAIDHERRLEFFAEGDRFPDLARSGRAEAAMGIPAFRVLWPIPQSEIDASPKVTQNPGY